jgi:glyoxylase-like metal-dependent hydrolase (beta-lactamase superfamily II)
VPILVDTFIREPSTPNWGNAVETRQEWSFEAQLKKHDLKPQDIGIIIHTHLHFDHSGNDALFPNAKIYIQNRELEYAATLTDPRSLQLFDKRDIADLVDRFRERLVLVDGEQEIADGVKLVWVGGHTAGSQAIYVETDEGTAIITGDACYVYDNIEKNIPTGIFFNYGECIKAMDRFRKEGRFIVVSHDLQVLDRYPKIPP